MRREKIENISTEEKRSSFDKRKNKNEKNKRKNKIQRYRLLNTREPSSPF